MLSCLVSFKMTNLRDIHAMMVMKLKSVLRRLNGMLKMKLNALSVKLKLMPKVNHGDAARYARKASVLNVSGRKCAILLSRRKMELRFLILTKN